MGYDDHVVLGKMNIRLDRVSADFNRTPEGAHGVLREGGFVATVGYGLWKAVLVEGPSSRRDEGVL